MTTIDTHLDVFLQNDSRLTLVNCGFYGLSLEEKTKIESIRIQVGSSNGAQRRGWFGSTRSTNINDNEMIEVFRVLSSELPSLKLLRIRFRATSLHLRALSLFLQNAKNLVSLRIFDVRFKASCSNDWTELEQALQTHCCLHRVTWDLCRIEEEEEEDSNNTTTDNSLALVIGALAENSHVEFIALNSTKISPQNTQVTRSWLESLASSSSLKTLKLEMIEEIQNEHIVWLAQTLLAENTTSPRKAALEELCIESCRVEESGCYALAQYLRVDPGLKKLELVLYTNDRSNSSSGQDEPNNKDIDWDKVGMADALIHNSSLTYLRIFAENITTHGYQDAFVRMIRTNNTLNHLILGWDGDSSEEVAFYLMLNRHGRRYLTEESSKKKWVDFIIEHCDDLSVLQYVFTSNPSLVQEIQTSIC